MNYKKKLMILSLFLLVFALSTVVLSIPPPAAEFYGNVTYNNVSAPVNINISAYDSNGTLCGTFFVGNSGYYGLLSCDGDDLNSTEDEGALTADNITFKINGTPAMAFGDYAWVSGKFSWVNLRDNRAPILYNLSNQILTAGVSYHYLFNASDPDGDIVYHYDNTSLFDISVLIGLINFTPWTEDIGNHSVQIKASDGQLYSLINVNYFILKGYCGDGLCSAIDETCLNCPQDCGICPGSTGGAVDSGGGRSSGRVSFDEIVCKETWVCGEWSICYPNGTQDRKCEDTNNCGTTKYKPVTVKTCIPPGTCHDGIQNQGEEGIDCGGPCPPCMIFVEDGAYGKLPTEEVPQSVCGDGYCSEGENCICPKDCRDPSLFPWWIFLLIFAAIILLLIITIVILYLLQNKDKITPEDFKKLARISIIISGGLILLTLLFMFLCYWLWWCWPNIILALIIIIFVLTGLILLTYNSYKYVTRYDEERKKEELRALMGGHLNQLKDLIKIEGRLIQKIESKLVERIYELFKAKDPLLKDFPSLLKIYNEIRKLQAHRESKNRLYEIEIDLIVDISELIKDENYTSKLEGEEAKVLREIDEELKLIMGFLARKHKIVNRIAKIRSKVKKKKTEEVSGEQSSSDDTQISEDKKSSDDAQKAKLSDK